MTVGLDLDFDLFERIERVVSNPSKAAAVFSSVRQGLQYMPRHVQLMHLFGAYDDLIHVQPTMPERDVQRGLRDALPDLYREVLAYGNRPDQEINYEDLI